MSGAATTGSQSVQSRPFPAAGARAAPGTFPRGPSNQGRSPRSARDSRPSLRSPGRITKAETAASLVRVELVERARTGDGETRNESTSPRPRRRRSEGHLSNAFRWTPAHRSRCGSGQHERSDPSAPPRGLWTHVQEARRRGASRRSPTRSRRVRCAAQGHRGRSRVCRAGQLFTGVPPVDGTDAAPVSKAPTQALNSMDRPSRIASRLTHPATRKSPTWCFLLTLC